MKFLEFRDEFYKRISSSLILPKKQVEIFLSARLCGKHILLEGAPGTGKTSLAKILGVLSGGYQRIQMTSDLTPSDIVGYEMYHSELAEKVEFKKGPIFTPFLLVDEINRAMPRTQSALLEAMEEKKVSVNGTNYSLPNDFLVVATRNPFDMDGTYLLPASQRDRFGVGLRFELPHKKDLQNILKFHLRNADENEKIEALELPSSILWKKITLDDEWFRICEELQDFLKYSLEKGFLPASVRAFSTWFELGQCLSCLRNQEHLSTEAMRDLLIPIFMHRMEPFGEDDRENILLKAFDKITGK